MTANPKNLRPFVRYSILALVVTGACVVGDPPNRDGNVTDPPGGTAGSPADGGVGAIGGTGGVAGGGDGGTKQPVAGEGGSGEPIAGTAGSATGGAAGAAPITPENGGTGGAPLEVVEGGMGGEPTTGGGGNEVDPDGPRPGTEKCPAPALAGWATVSGHGFDELISGGADGDEVEVTTAEDLQTYASSPDPYVIRIRGTIQLPTGVLDVTSNKTLVGVGHGATIEGGIRVQGTSAAPEDMVSNVVIQNLNINAATADTSPDQDEDDGITVAYAHHVWIDHVDILDAPGDNLDIIRGSDYVTVSWSRFRYQFGFRRPATRVGHSDANAAEDADRLKVTFHHNWWMESVDQRMPRVRFGDVHVYNNYYSNIGDLQPKNSYCIAAALESDLLVQNNYFDGVVRPHVFFSFANGAAVYEEATATMVAEGNTYVAESEEEAGRQSGEATFTPDYVAAIEPADDVMKERIRLCSGPI